MTTAYDAERLSILDKFKQNYIRVKNTASISEESFADILKEEERDYREYLGWDISEHIREKMLAVGNGDVIGSALIQDKNVICYVMAVPVNHFLYLNSFILREYSDKGYLEDMLLLFCGDILKKSDWAIEGQPFLLYHELDTDRFYSFKNEIILKSYMTGSTSTISECENQRPDIEIKNIRLEADILADILLDSYSGSPESRVSGFYADRASAYIYMHELIQMKGCGNYIRNASFAAFYMGMPVGFIITTMIGDGMSHIPQIAIRRKYQNTGIGTFLISKAVSALYKSGIQNVSLSAAKDLHVYKWYLHIGFKPVVDFWGFRFICLKNA